MNDINTLILVYRSESGEEFTQFASELVEVGTLIEPDSGDDMQLIGWTTVQSDLQCSGCEEPLHRADNGDLLDSNDDAVCPAHAAYGTSGLYQGHWFS